MPKRIRPRLKKETEEKLIAEVQETKALLRGNAVSKFGTRQRNNLSKTLTGDGLSEDSLIISDAS
jgi:hypothetical protein